MVTGGQGHPAQLCNETRQLLDLTSTTGWRSGPGLQNERRVASCKCQTTKGP